jgi:hypothetical protein
MFADMRRAGMGLGLSKAKLSRAMLEILVQLPAGTQNLKERVLAHLGLIGQMSPARDINAAWNEAKKQAAREFPDKFVLDDRKGLHWNDGSVKVLDKRISAANLRKLNKLAEGEACSVDQLVSTLIRQYKKGRA